MSSNWQVGWSHKHQRWFWEDRKRGLSTWDRPPDFNEPLPERPDAPVQGLDLAKMRVGLPEGWDCNWDFKHQRIYYFNRKTDERTWKRPIDVELELAKMRVGLPEGWECNWDLQHQQIYYFNRKTEERTWKRPIDVKVSFPSTSSSAVGGFASFAPMHWTAAAAASQTSAVAQPAGYQAAAASQTPSAAAGTFASSAFRELYEKCPLSTDYDILHFAHDYISWLKKEGFADVAQTVNKKLLEKVRAGFTVAQLAIFTWTLTEQVQGRELCSYMNEIVREDNRERLQPLIPLVRAMNSFLVSRGKTAAEWPPENVTYRGAGIPDEHMDFFQSGVRYRCPMFLATSFDHEVAMDFARMNRQEKNMVIFHVHYDEDLRCRHVNYLKGATDVESEAEFLFPPYSAFTVKSAPEKEGKKWVIHIEAFPDNCEAPEDLPLALWH